ncbi:MAG: ABC transporter ATP-binding protein [Spirochaetes bacterium RBG_16_49_21]|nr:MAG: ABC transporter ATP-binding protein [Spirochaetes bacterium RBG_16_49_21]
MITVINLTKSFGRQLLFDSVSFSINPRERIGLVGRNGHGKTTLFRIIVGEEHADSGEVAIPRNYRVGYVTQQLRFTENSVLAEACKGLAEQHGETWMAEKVLSGLGFTKKDILRRPDEFSGGFQVRLNLVKVLVSEPELLLLDEPTNYLDIVSIRWLEKYLRQWKGELVVITHDRSFMDSVTTHIMGIHRQKLRKIEGGTDKYYGQILKEEEIYEKTRINDEKKRREAELFISRFRAKARLAGMVQSRIKALEKQEKLDRLARIKSLDFSFSCRPFPGKVLLTADALSFSYTGEDMINDFSMTIGRNDRICVIGKNGKGKTTLLKLLSGELAPLSGSINSHNDMKMGYFAQTNTSMMNESFSIEEEIMSAGCDRQRARDIAGAMMFEDDRALKKIGVLSGGEKSRVLLARILAQKSNLLLLDEPTNHLDMESSDALLAAIDAFEGAAMVVTHNEMFLHTLANRFVVFQAGGVSVFEGTYQSFLARIGWEDERGSFSAGERSPSPSPAGEGDRDGVNKKELRRQRADILSRKSKIINPLKLKISEIEDMIESREKHLAGLNSDMIAASNAGSGARISRLSKEMHDARSKIEALYGELDELVRELEEKLRSFG